MKYLIRVCFLIVACCFFSCKDFQDVQCTGVKGFKINQVSTSGIDADIMLGIKNPNNFGFSIYKSEFNIVYSGINLGKAHLSKRVHINANTEEVYSFNLKSDLKNVNLMDIMSLLNGGARKGMIEVTGNLNVGKLYVKKSYPVNVKERVGLN